MRLLRAELHSKNYDKQTAAFQPGLNIIHIQDSSLAEDYLESLCAGILFVPVQSALAFDRVQLDFEDASTGVLRLDSVRGEGTTLSRGDVRTNTSALLDLTEFKEKFGLSLSPQSFTQLAGLNTQVELLTRNLSTEPDATPQDHKRQARELQTQQNKLKERHSVLRDLKTQLSVLDGDLVLDRRIDELSSDLIEQFKAVPVKKERFDSQKAKIESARVNEMYAFPQEIPLFREPNFLIGLLGMVASFTLAHVADIPLLALANLFFAALIAQLFFRRIDKRETTTRAKARIKAVDSADQRNQKSHTQSKVGLKEIAKTLGCEVSELQERVFSMTQRKEKRTRLEAEIKQLCLGQTYQQLESELEDLTNQIAHKQREILDDGFGDITQNPNVSKNPDLQSEQWDRMFFALLRADLGSAFSAAKLEAFVLEHLQRLSEGRYDGLTIADDGALTVVGPDDVFPVSFLKLNQKDQVLVSYAVRFGVVSYLTTSALQGPILFNDALISASIGRRLRFKDALEVLSKQAQIVVVSAADDWPTELIRNT
jgi:hypothetical protein